MLKDKMKALLAPILKMRRVQVWSPVDTKQAECLVKQIAFEYWKHKNPISIYLIGSVASGGYVPGRSDCDVLIVMCDGPSENIKSTLHLSFLTDSRSWSRKIWRKMTVRWDSGGYLRASFCIRPIRHLTNPFGELIWETRVEEKSWKDLSAAEDLLMLLDHGKLLYGKEIKDELALPTPSEMRRYYNWRARMLEAMVSEKERKQRDNSLNNLAKSIIVRARECYFLWTGRMNYCTQNLLDDIPLTFPTFPDIHILKEALDIRNGLFYNIQPTIEEMKKKRQVFFQNSSNFDREFLIQINSNEEPLSSSVLISPLGVGEKRFWDNVKFGD